MKCQTKYSIWEDHRKIDDYREQIVDLKLVNFREDLLSESQSFPGQNQCASFENISSMISKTHKF